MYFSSDTMSCGGKMTLEERKWFCGKCPRSRVYESSPGNFDGKMSKKSILYYDGSKIMPILLLGDDV
jgi:hypothetical protein